MNVPKKAVAVAAGLAAFLSVCVAPNLVAQSPAGGTDGGDTLVIEEATVDWIERSKVAALREGVIDRMELQIGMPVKKGKPIGYLHDELAKLSVAKAALAAKSEGPKAEALAKKELSITVVAVNKRLDDRQKGLVSFEEKQKAEAEVKVAVAMVLQAEEKIKLDEAELALAHQALEEHKILAPFDGIIIERMKNPGERVGANEAVVVLGNMDKLRAWAYVPVENIYQVKEGQVVEFQPRLPGRRRAVSLPIEQKKFRGKITFVDTVIQPVGEVAVRIYADFENKDFQLQPGFKGTMTIFLNSAKGAAVEARNAPVEAPSR